MNLIEPVDPAALATAFPHDTFAIRHRFAGNPLFSLARIVELTRKLPRDRIEYNSGNAAISQDPATTPMIDLAPEEIVRRIETCGAWMVLKRVESEPEYRALLEQVMETVARARGFNGISDAGFTDIQSFLFVSSPHSTTPFHADNEDNFFVQIHGDKLFHVYDNRDRSIASDDMLEDVVAKHRNLHYEPAFDAKATHYRLDAGDGIFVPYQWPHYVQSGETYSISLAMTWKSEEVRRRNDTFVVNSILRCFGLPQRPPGQSPALDAVKVAALRIVAALAEPLRRSETMRRTLRRLVLGRNANYYYGEANRPNQSAA